MNKEFEPLRELLCKLEAQPSRHVVDELLDEIDQIEFSGYLINILDYLEQTLIKTCVNSHPDLFRLPLLVGSSLRASRDQRAASFFEKLAESIEAETDIVFVEATIDRLSEHVSLERFCEVCGPLEAKNSEFFDLFVKYKNMRY